MQIIYILILATAVADSDSCDADPEDHVCMMQFMKHRQKHRNHHAGENHFHDQLEHLVEHGCPECPGVAFEAVADAGICSHGGAEVTVMFDKEDIETFYGDNVVMSHFRYHLESSPQGPCTTGCELINPDVHNHQYPVGVTKVRVDGYDVAGNWNSCHRTVSIVDDQPPVFADRSGDLDTTITIQVDPGTCKIDAGVPFAKYEDMGFVAEATDNCDDDVQIVKKILLNGVETTSANLTGPGDYRLVYTAIDDHSVGLFPDRQLEHSHHTTTHTVTLVLVDNEAPYGFTDCPESQVIEIEAHETSTIATWVPPRATGDNCDEFFDLPPAEEQHYPPHHPGESFDIGIHTITYAFKDAAGNELTEMCTFTIQVIPKAHPVVVTCPHDVVVPVVEHANFGIVEWDPPIVMQHDKQLGPEYVIYPQGVESGMAFRFGVTSVTVRARGQITENRTREHEMEDECAFNVTVTDPYAPKVEGSMYRCKSKGVAGAGYRPDPYELCAGQLMKVDLFDTYLDTHGYEIVSTKHVPINDFTECCVSEDNVPHTCTQIGTTVTHMPAHYCVPSGPAVAEPESWT